MLKFPHVNIEWLINGTGEMYKQTEASGQNQAPSPTLFSKIDTEQLPDNQEETETVSQNINPQSMQKSKQTKDMQTNPKPESTSVIPIPEALISEVFSPKNTDELKSEPETKSKPQTSQQLNTVESDLIEKSKERDIEFVLIFYTDKTFKHYKLV
jgi:hypothetical protein